MHKPTIKIKDLDLQPCCRQALTDIKDKIEVGRDLKKILVGAPFFLLVFGSIESTVASNVAEGVIGVDSWDIWAQAVKGVDPIVKNRCKHIAAMEFIKHKGGPLNQFWKAMNDSFQRA